MEFTSYLVTFVAALLAASIIQPFVIHFAKKRNLLEANDDRKTHTERVSNLGGIAVIAAFFIAMLAVVKPSADSPLIAFTLALPLFAVSLFDDLFGAGVTLRFVVQAILGVLLFEMGFQIINIEGMWVFNLGATVFFTMLMINAYNLIDGINGLAGGLGLAGSIIFGAALAASGNADMALASFAYAGALLGFLFFNFGKKARIFMGDNGSTVLGFIMALLAMTVLQSGDGAAVFSANLPLVAAVIAVPVMDVFKVAAFRMVRMQSPFSPDRSHIHHLFTDGLLSHPAACAVLLGWTTVLAGLAVTLPEWLTPPLALLLASAHYFLAKGLRFTKKITNPASVVPATEQPVIH